MFLFLLQLAKEREEEAEKNRVEEQNLEEKKKKEPERKVFTKGVGKFINPNLKKEAR